MADEAKLEYVDFPPGEALGLRRMAHDLMTPITVLMGNLQLFQMRKDVPAPVAAKIDDLYKQAQNLMKLVQEAQKHAYDDAWQGNSGPLWNCWVSGIEAGNSVLSRTGVSVDWESSKCEDEWLGEPEAWREWMGSLLASVASRVERGGKITLSAVTGGWKLSANPLILDSERFNAWIKSLAEPISSHEIAGVRRYREMLTLNSCKPKVHVTAKELVIEFIKG